MNWYKKAKKKEDGFEYSDLIRNFWDEILRKEKKRVGIGFDLENNDSVDEAKYIDFDKEFKSHNGDKKKYRIYAQLMSAGGDWENNVYYFRTQVEDKSYFDARGEWSDRWNKAQYTFIYIPNKSEGNQNLIKPSGKDSKNEWVVSGNSEVDSYDFKPKDMKKLWDNLKKHTIKRIKDYEEDYYEEYDVDLKKVIEDHNMYKTYDLTRVFGG